MISNSLATKLKNEKWAILSSAFDSLISSAALLQANPTLAVSQQSEFKVDGVAADSDNIAVIFINGVLVKGASPEEEEALGLCNIDNISTAITEANADQSVSSICLIFNSPGGETCGIEELGRQIATSPKIIYAWTETRCCSAAYWLASQCSVIGMTPSANVGAIGVYRVVEDVTEAMKMAGIKKEAIYSGKYKLLQADFKTMTDEEKAIIQKDVIECHDKFKAAILSKRQVADEYMQGLSYDAKALEANLADIVVDNFNQFLQTDKYMTKTTKISDPAKHAESTVSANIAGEVPGVPGTKTVEATPAKAESGHYDGGYIACPACKLTYKIEQQYMIDPASKAEGDGLNEDDKEPAKEEPKEKAETPKQTVFDDKKPLPGSKEARLAAFNDPHGFQKALGIYKPKKANGFVEALNGLNKPMFTK